MSQINELVKIRLGDYEQSVLIRGKEQDSPILLFLHGGPGVANIGIAATTQTEWEEKFVVVNWDQLGGGLSYKKGIDKNAMTIEKMLQYLNELVLYLTKRFKKEKIIIVGHSWGSVLGLIYTSRYTEHVAKYISVSQPVNTELNEKIAYEYCWRKANEKNNRKAKKQLNQIGKPPYDEWEKGLQIRASWTNKFGAMTVKGTPAPIYIKAMLKGKEYGLSDFIKWFGGLSFSISHLWPEIMKVNMSDFVQNINVPVLFCLGENDYNASSELAEGYINKLTAKTKQIIWFENSAHMCFLEEKEKFNNVLFKFALSS